MPDWKDAKKLSSLLSDCKRQEEGKSNGKLTTYFKSKDNFGIENYSFMKNFEHRKIICKFRISGIVLITLELKVGDMR